MGRAKQPPYFVAYVNHIFDYIFRDYIIYFIFRKIDGGFQMRNLSEDRMTHRLDFSGKMSGQMARCHRQRTFCPGTDDIHDSLCL